MADGDVVAPATAADLDAIDAISRHSFRTPWPRQTFVDELSRPHGRLVVARAGADGPVVGYANYWLVADEVHLLAIAVHPDHRRRGLGALLLGHVVAIAAGARLITLEVRAGNAPAIALYARAGFVAVSTRRGYYGGDDEDAVVMLREPA